MPNYNAKVGQRLIEKLKRFQSILSSAKARDINESDTVVIVTDLLSDLFGYDKYSEITTEHAIRGTWCDLAIVLEEKFALLIEVKAIGLTLKDNHIKQAVDYAANKGVDWVILTNGVIWQVYKINFTKPISEELVLDLDLLNLSHKNKDHIYDLFLISKEGLKKNSLDEFNNQRQATSKYILANLLVTEPILKAIKKELRIMYPDIKVELDEIRNTLSTEVLKREVAEGEMAQAAIKKINRRNRKQSKKNPSDSVVEDEVEKQAEPTPNDPTTIVV
ncbi:MAG TPA: type I restriction enzyme HsdR N-terminal domain-containing protein [bacterium]|nr:type I restriction enzyme HsdR N-terminal domain-containing protein [bacterium]